MINIVVIDADPSIYAQVQTALSREEYHLTSARSSIAGLQAIQRVQPDLVILDSALPQSDGLILCRQLRAESATSRIAILFLTSGKSAYEVASALDAGGDDHLCKPFVARELAARVRALLRRSTGRRPNRLTLTLEPDSQTVSMAGRRIVLTPTEYDLLNTLSKHRGQHMTAGALLQEVWKYPPGTGDTALVRNHVHNLRVKLEEDPDRPQIVISHHGRGYTLAVEFVRQVEGSRFRA